MGLQGFVPYQTFEKPVVLHSKSHPSTINFKPRRHGHNPEPWMEQPLIIPLPPEKQSYSGFILSRVARVSANFAPNASSSVSSAAAVPPLPISRPLLKHR